ncbi:MAG: hypothetical protein KatS3mg110_3741 [Pirellulaceae bacterium]|nr:MAG: hypothetical protein KatS3mg110_3741 [Pirellulaceae bacterium]
MNVLGELRRRFAEALRALVDDPKPMLAQVLPTQDERFGDYQANFAMALARPLRKPPRQIAEHVVSALDVDDLCEPPEIAGPGFINLKLRREWLAEQLRRMAADPRLGISPVSQPRTVVIDYSSPNVAKPMHVGHIRSTVIGDALYRTMRFLGHRVLSDNHLGDWGTQFGMILYGYKHFRDEENYRRQPVAELSRLYKLMHQLVDYHEAMRSLEQLEQRRQTSSDPAAFQEQLQELQRRVARVAEDPQLLSLARQHPQIATAVLEETAKLHAGDPENRKLWSEFMPLCLEEINRIYQRLGITFDMQLGESFYQPMLADVVRELQGKGLARISDGAVCVFLEGFDTPMIVQKSDGAYLYATTDLATLKYRMEHFHPDAILYVVDARQSDHFAKLFATARLWGYRDVELQIKSLLSVFLSRSSHLKAGMCRRGRRSSNSRWSKTLSIMCGMAKKSLLSVRDNPITLDSRRPSPRTYPGCHLPLPSPSLCWVRFLFCGKDVQFCNVAAPISTKASFRSLQTFGRTIDLTNSASDVHYIGGRKKILRRAHVRRAIKRRFLSAWQVIRRL